MAQPENNIVVGRLGAVYGIKGWLKVSSFTDEPESIFSYSPWSVGRDKLWQEVNIVEWRRHNKGLIVKLENVDVREKAQLLTGMDICVSPEQFPDLSEDEYYWRDLVGLSVVNLNGYNMGVVKSLLETGSNDVLVVKGNTNDAFSISERLIPLIEDQVIKSIDTDTKLITVDWEADF
ncbi:ribosome maturation factor RimM [Catenovulum adriaticum]|uniref:Ribosome maturation factor RimM n=1 Tax=Catenovulum adriaticum TaxID=2984846 RepID=A0ABY7APN8_9ALTE|nr:ribosome maturation factor RimM [Catenovulum sp. TS8]WAJ71237.1 ribosome maturation factor RimM [Catenovulum sp. TS8]